MGEGSADWDYEHDGLEAIAVGASIVVMGLLAVGLLAAGVSWWWMAFPIGGGLVPLATGLAERYGNREAGPGDGEPEDALDELRVRYARGELTEAEFEDRLERLLETETVAQARDSLERERPPTSERELE